MAKASNENKDIVVSDEERKALASQEYGVDVSNSALYKWSTENNRLRGSNVYQFEGRLNEKAQKEGYDDWVEKVLDMADNGFGMVEIYGWMNVSEMYIAKQMKIYPALKNLFKQVETRQKAWWYSQGIHNLSTDKDASTKFNYNLWYMNMKNRYKWSDRQDPADEQRAIPITIVQYGSKVEPIEVHASEKIVESEEESESLESGEIVDEYEWGIEYGEDDKDE